MNRNNFHILLDAGKFKVKVLADWCVVWAASCIIVFSCVLTQQKATLFFNHALWTCSKELLKLLV